MQTVHYREINAEEDGQRLDNFLIRILKGVPRSHIYRIIRGGEVRINKKRAKVSTRLQCGDQVRIPPIRCSVEKEIRVGEKLEKQLQECLLFEDNEMLVVNKPTGLAVHGGSGLSLGLIEALRKSRADLPFLELVHRLDKETSGCILLAKKRSILRALQALLAARQMEKTYWALLAHAWSGEDEQVVNAPLKKNTLKSGERLVTISQDGKEAETVFRLLENFEDACLVAVSPKTGRTHQIRVHSAFLGHPIIGDEKYGESKLKIAGLSKMRLFLHARALHFGINEKKHHYQANLDAVFIEALSLLRSRRNSGE